MELQQTHQKRRAYLVWYLAVKCKGDRQKLMSVTGLTKGRVAQLLDTRQAFGDNAARNLERRLHLQEGAMDYGPPQSVDDRIGHSSHVKNDTNPPNGGIHSGGNTAELGVLLPVLTIDNIDLMQLKNNDLRVRNLKHIEPPGLVHGPRAKAMQMPDDSLRHMLIGSGDWLEFDPDMHPRNGNSIVLVRLGSEMHLIRRYDPVEIDRDKLTIVATCTRTWRELSER